MNKGSAAKLQGTRALELAGRTLTGGLCGIGLMWVLTAMWPPAKPYVYQVGRQIETMSDQHPVVMVGLMAGILASLVWQAAKR